VTEIPDGYVRAAWAGAGRVRLDSTGEILQPGDTAIVPATEAEESGHWQPVQDDPPKKPRGRGAVPAPTLDPEE